MMLPVVVICGDVVVCVVCIAGVAVTAGGVVGTSGAGGCAGVVIVIRVVDGVVVGCVIFSVGVGIVDVYACVADMRCVVG